MGNSLIVFGLGSLPIFLWGAYFRHKSPRKQRLGEIIGIFALGTLSIFPVLFFHQFIAGRLLSWLLRQWPWLAKGLLPAVLQLILTLGFVMVFILLFAFLHSLITTLVYRLPLKHNFSTAYKRLYNLAPLLLFFVVFLLIELLTGFLLDYDFLLSIAGSTVFFAVLEEYFKYIINPFLVYRKISSIGTAMVNALYVGLAFSFVENALFFYVYSGTKDFLEIFAYRSIFTTLLHVCASGMLGYFYGLSLFSKSMVTAYEIEKAPYPVPAWLVKIFGLKKETLFRSASVTQGFFLAALLHGVFNLLLSLGLKAFAAILAMILGGGTIWLLRSKAVQLQYGLIGTMAMPEEDFEKLRLQISVLQHLKEIRSENKKNGIGS